MLPHTLRVPYPEQARAGRVEGEVLLAFVVRPDSTVDQASVRVLKSDHAVFTQVVLAHVDRFRYVPAMLDCRSVARLVQQPFAFGPRPPTGVVR
jgi:TonB family protein